MKKTVLVIGLIIIVLGVVGALGVRVVFAQSSQLPIMGQSGWMHDYIEQALAAKLGLTEQQVEDQLAAGKSMYQIALDNGIKQEDLANFMTDVHKTAFDKAVKDGLMTQQQADWMLQRMQNMPLNGYGPGNCPMHNGQAAPFQRGQGIGPGMMNGSGMMGGWGMMGGYQNP